MTMQVANTILQQLGGNRFIAMTGAKHFVGSSNSLQFSIGRGAKDKINKVKITLDEGQDLYSMEFYYFRGMNYKKIGKAEEGLYFDMLQERFTDRTGMYTQL